MKLQSIHILKEAAKNANADPFQNKEHPSLASELRLVRNKLAAFQKEDSATWNEICKLRDEPLLHTLALTTLRAKRKTIEDKITLLKQRKQFLINRIRWG